MNELEKLLNKIEEFIDEKNNLSEYEMSNWIEVFMIENGEAIYTTGNEVADFINDRIVCEICERTEPGLEGTNFRKEIEEAYHKIKGML